MFQSPLHHWVGEYRRQQCIRSVYPAIQLLVEKAHLAGWSREEILIAITDAADSQLSDVTETLRATFIEIADPVAGSPEELPQKRPPLLQRNSSILPG